MTSSAQSAQLVRTDRVPALAGTVVFHAVLLAVFFLSMVQLLDPPAAGEAGLVLDYRAAEAVEAQPAAGLAEARTAPEQATRSAQTSAATATPALLTGSTETTVAIPAGAGAAVALNPAAVYVAGAGDTQGQGRRGDGDALQLPGWRWLEKPVVSEASAATGRLVFEIKVAENGEIINCHKLAGESTFNDPVAEQLYFDAIQKTEFERTGNEDRGAVGKVIFVIGAR